MNTTVVVTLTISVLGLYVIFATLLYIRKAKQAHAAELRAMELELVADQKARDAESVTAILRLIHAEAKSNPELQAIVKRCDNSDSLRKFYWQETKRAERLAEALNQLAVDCESGMLATECDPDDGQLIARDVHDSRIAARCRSALSTARNDALAYLLNSLIL